MQTIITQRLTLCKDRLARVQHDLADLAQKQQDLLQEALQLQGAIREFEAIVVAVPVPVDGAVVVQEGE